MGPNQKKKKTVQIVKNSPSSSKSALQETVMPGLQTTKIMFLEQKTVLHILLMPDLTNLHQSNLSSALKTICKICLHVISSGSLHFNEGEASQHVNSTWKSLSPVGPHKISWHNFWHYCTQTAQSSTNSTAKNVQLYSSTIFPFWHNGCTKIAQCDSTM